MRFERTYYDLDGKILYKLAVCVANDCGYVRFFGNRHEYDAVRGMYEYCVVGGYQHCIYILDCVAERHPELYRLVYQYALWHSCKAFSENLDLMEYCRKKNNELAHKFPNLTIIK